MSDALVVVSTQKYLLINCRNIIEKSHSELVAGRRACISASDEAMLLQFKKAVEGDRWREHQQPRHRQLRPVGGLIIIGLLACALFAVVLVSCEENIVQ